jgi:glycosyltransferase involved in cell wall biosynthesis
VAQLARDRVRAMKLRVLVVMPLGVALGGGEEMLRQLMREGRGQGIEWIVVFLREGPLVEEIHALGVETHVIGAGRFRQLLTRMSAIRRIVRLAQMRGADLVFGWMVAGQATAGPAAMLAGLPNAWYQVGTPGPDWLDRFATLWPARGVLALSKAGVERQSAIWPRKRVRLVHPGASFAAVEAARVLGKAELRTRLGLDPRATIVGTVGRLQRWKGMHVFLDALALLLKQRPDLHGVIVGGPHETEPRYGDELRAQAERLGVTKSVTFTGFQPNATEWMQSMDVFVHAADHEPFGIVVVEAMALGKPVVAGAEGGPAEIITDGVNGLLAPYGNAGAMAAAVGRVVDDPTFAERLGAAARERAGEFTDRSFAARVIAAIREFAAS